MALFALWHDSAAGAPVDALQRRLEAEAHVVPERLTQTSLVTPQGCWHLAAFATATRFYAADAQLWLDPAGGACILHGLIWRIDGGQPRLLDARAVATLLDRPGRALPEDIAGEYAIARLHADGTLEAFADPAGLHQLFHRTDRRPAIANRAAFLAALAEDREPDREAALWLGAIGYRVGTHSGWRGVEQLPQGHRLRATTPSDVQIGGPDFALPHPRGFAAGGAALLDEGLEQAKAAVRLAAGDGPLELPITGGKDSRVVLAIALAAGLRDRLSLFTRGYSGHPDVVVGAMIADTLGVPHRREPPRGHDAPPDLSGNGFLHVLARIAYQGDGGIGGWDEIARDQVGRDSLVSGHMGEVLKGYAKRPANVDVLDPAAMVRLKGPFDPLALLRPGARALLEGRLAEQMRQARDGGALSGDLPDLFYWRNRVPNWLGGIRGVASFERQPVLPLGVPALLRLAFLLTPEERRAELAHFALIQRAAPQLLPLPFAHQRWDPALPDAPMVAPVAAAPDTPLFGTWQWAMNDVDVRASLSALVARADVPLWDDVDRARLLLLLRERTFDYFDGIALLGTMVAVLHQSGQVVRDTLGGPRAAIPDEPGEYGASDAHGHLDGVSGAGALDDGVLVVADVGELRLHGWMQSLDWPGAAVRVEAWADDALVARASAGQFRPDLAAAGIGSGHHGFTLTLDAADLRRSNTLTLRARGSTSVPVGGRLVIRPRAG